MFSTIATSNDSTSLRSKIVTGISCKPALWAANHLLSPATISYFVDPELLILTAIGWIIPFFFIEFDNSSSFSSLKFCLGW